MASDRRALLRGLAALPVAAVALPTLAGDAAAEPIVGLRGRYLEHVAESDRIYSLPHEQICALGERADAPLTAAFKAMDEAEPLAVNTLPGALAALEWGRDEFARYYVEEPEEPDAMDQWTLAMLDKAIGVLRASVEGGRA